jgi:hypothetical protein
LGKGNGPVQAYSPTTIGAMPTKNGGALMGKPMDQVKAFVRQLISIVGRYGTLDKEFPALMTISSRSTRRSTKAIPAVRLSTSTAM